MEKTKKAPKLALRYATVAMAALIGTFAVSNGVCYAATGETWVEQVVVMVGGDPVEVTVKGADPVVVSVRGDGAAEGEVVYRTDATAETGQGAGTAQGTYTVSELGAAEAGDGVTALVLEGADGRVHVSVAGGDPMDVTEALARDGAASGTCEVDGVSYAYQVTGEKGAYRAVAEQA